MEQLWVPSLPLLGGMMLPLLRHCCSFGSYHALTWRSIFQTSGREHTQIRSWSAQCSANHEGASVSEKDSPKMILAVPDDSLLDARILFCTSPALGHNKEAHPESNKRVPAIIDALDKLELSPKTLSSSVADTFRAFLDEPSLAAQFDDPAMLFEESTRRIKEAIENAKGIHSL